MLPQAMIFDMDGLMIDTEPLYWEVARKIAARWGKTVADQTLRSMMGRGALESIGIFAREVGLPETPENLLELRSQLMLERFGRRIDLMPGLAEMLRAFHGRLKLAIATSAPRRFTDVLLPNLDLGRWFDVVQTGDTVERGKPHPDIYLAAIAGLKTPAGACVVLEDTTTGARAGKNAGAFVIAVPTHLTDSQDFSFVDARCGSLFEAREVIDSLLGQSQMAQL